MKYKTNNSNGSVEIPMRMDSDLRIRVAQAEESMLEVKDCRLKRCVTSFFAKLCLAKVWLPREKFYID